MKFSGAEQHLVHASALPEHAMLQQNHKCTLGETGWLAASNEISRGAGSKWNQSSVRIRFPHTFKLLSAAFYHSKSDVYMTLAEAIWVVLRGWTCWSKRLLVGCNWRQVGSTERASGVRKDSQNNFAEARKHGWVRSRNIAASIRTPYRIISSWFLQC